MENGIRETWEGEKRKQGGESDCTKVSSFPL